jgi:hypothetical protein
VSKNRAPLGSGKKPQQAERRTVKKVDFIVKRKLLLLTVGRCTSEEMRVRQAGQKLLS